MALKINKRALQDALAEAGEALTGNALSGAPEPMGVGWRVQTRDQRRWWVKPGPLAALRAEAKGLDALREGGEVYVPHCAGVHPVGDSGLLWLIWCPSQPVSLDVWAEFGDQLAQLHERNTGPEYGWPHTNHLGATPQRNQPSRDWVSFFQTQRLSALLEEATRQGVEDLEISRAISRVSETLPEWLPTNPPPALCHGDLWSGNCLPTRTEAGHPAIAVIDPACYIGDGWSDIAMMRLFGGFPQVCFDAYQARRPRLADDRRRTALYQLYHLLNHWLLFGGHYRESVLAEARHLSSF